MVEKMAKLFLIDSGPDYLRATIVLVLIIVFFAIILIAIGHYRSRPKE